MNKFEKADQLEAAIRNGIHRLQPVSGLFEVMNKAVLGLEEKLDNFVAKQYATDRKNDERSWSHERQRISTALQMAHDSLLRDRELAAARNRRSR